ncbi:zinc-binding alcohol dehydrogenase family protein [Curvibacter sp. CHRR-16]|uniref:zinc-binding alcohol dehydrogenase family protein n=1 Tax=Curvibacter sp. CHRR-16 TaxID=2835872 RepID=UPI001BDB0301|nr:zinc-binding alcohol dehydrogenase family protein [Curvibacter sp. CHRR-16]MBT0569264.1 zinc-binding alcohol dehydrogenase family protein [Curvibacter sp. CHRR-16]
MKAIVYAQHGLPIADAQSLYTTELPMPTPGPRDLLVQVQAIAVNPVDTKVRRNAPTQQPRVLGWDAVGTVQAVGEQVRHFKVGDAVFYAGAIDKPGSYAQYQVVDERVVGHKPASLSAAQAAALPLTSLTAWELLFDRLQIARLPAAGAPESERQANSQPTLLVIGAGGGVGSILVQLARQLTAVRLVVTAARAETRQWLLDLGAEHVIDHSQALAPQLAALGIAQVDYAISITHTDQYFEQLVELIRPQGKFALIDDPVSLNAVLLKRKSISLHWESMFTRSLFQTDDMERQHEILEQVSALVDQGVLRSTLAEHYGPVTDANLRRAHALIESAQSRGKIVMEW